AFLMRKNKIQVFRGTGRLAGAGVITVHDAQETLSATLHAPHVILATGARPRALPGLPFDQQHVLSSTEAMLLQEAPEALVIIGVQGNIEHLGLETAGVYSERGFIPVDAHCCTNVPGIYAIGDVNGPPCLAHLASAEGIATVEAIAGLDNPGVNYDNIPGC